LPKRRTKVGVLYLDPVRGHTVLLSEQKTNIEGNIRRSIMELRRLGYQVDRAEAPHEKRPKPTAPPPVAPPTVKPPPPPSSPGAMPDIPVGAFEVWMMPQSGFWSRSTYGPYDSLEMARRFCDVTYAKAPAVVTEGGKIVHFNNAAAERWPDALLG
jgi:hypothetical protein